MPEVHLAICVGCNLQKPFYPSFMWLFDADMKLWILRSVFYCMCYDFKGFHRCLATWCFGLFFTGLGGS